MVHANRMVAYRMGDVVDWVDKLWRETPSCFLALIFQLVVQKMVTKSDR